MRSTGLPKMREWFSDCWEMEWFLPAVSLPRLLPPFPMLNTGSQRNWGPHKPLCSCLRMLSCPYQQFFVTEPVWGNSFCQGKKDWCDTFGRWIGLGRRGQRDFCETKRNMDAACPRTILLSSFLPKEKSNPLFCEDWQNSCACFGTLLTLVVEYYPDQIPRGVVGIWRIRLYTRFYWAFVSPGG